MRSAERLVLWRRLLCRLLRRRLLLLVHAVILRLQHLIKFLFLLVAGQGATDFGDRVFSDGMDLLDLVFAGKGVVLDYFHGLGMLVLKSCFHLGLLLGRKLELPSQGLHLIVNAMRLSGLS